MTQAAHATVRRIVVAHDGSRSARTAFDAALELAESRGTDLLVLSAIDRDPDLPRELIHLPPDAGAVVGEAFETARARLGDSRVAAALLAGDPTDVVLRTLRPDDMAVLGSHSHGPVTRALLGSVSREVAAHARVPVLVVRPGSRTDGDHVLVGVDGSPTSVAAVRIAAEEADRTGLPLTAVLVVPLVVGLTGVVRSPDDPALRDADAVLHGSLAGLREDHPGLTVSAEVVHGAVVSVLLERAGRARLVVVGSRGRGALRAAVRGSVGRGLLEHARCPVLVAR